MRTFKKSSTAIITTLALGLLPALPAAAQTYTVQVSQGAKTESGEPGAPMKFTVVQKPGAGKEDVIITLVEDTEAKADQENGPMYSTTAEYDVTTAGSKAASIR